MKSIILCADDYGQNQAISQAIIELIKNDRLSATSCMTNSPLWPQHATWLSPLRSRADMGLHFNLTEGVPLSDRLKNAHGFMPLSKLIIRAYWRLLNAAAIEEEFIAQLEAFRAAMGAYPDFIDGHQHVQQLPIISKII